MIFWENSSLVFFFYFFFFVFRCWPSELFCVFFVLVLWNIRAILLSPVFFLDLIEYYVAVGFSFIRTCVFFVMFGPLVRIS